jgi:hypothetical protein
MEENIKQYLDANFTALRANMQSMSDVLHSEIKRTNDVNEEQHKRIIDLIEHVKGRVDDCEDKSKYMEKKLSHLKMAEAKAKGVWASIVFAASIFGYFIIEFFKKHIK